MNYLPIKFFIVSLLFIAIIALSSSAVLAEELSLYECITLAKRNNPTLKTSYLNQQIAKNNIQMVKSTIYPRINGNLGYNMQLDPQAVIISGRVAETQDPDFIHGGLGASYTIYDFGRRSASLKQAKKGFETISYSYMAEENNIALVVIETYFSLLQLDKQLETANQQEQQLMKHKEVAQALFDNGVVTRNDILQADVRLASIRQKILTIMNEKQNRWYTLNYLTGKPADFTAVLSDKTVIATKDTSPSEKFSLLKRPEISAATKATEQAEAALEESKLAFYPEIYGAVSLDYVQNSKVREQTIMAATIGVKVNFFDGFASTSAKQNASLQYAKAHAILMDTNSKVNLEMATSLNDMAVAKKKITVAEAVIAQSKENLRINEERYKERVGTATEVLDAQTLFAEAQNDYYQSLYELQVANARYQKAIGNLL